MHTYLKFFIFWYIDWVGTFLLVFLSPSLLLLISCVMAPKWKSVPSHNLFHSGTSTSSSDPTPSSVCFHDEKARKDFSKNFSRRGVHLERQVILSNIFNIDLPTIIHSRGWESLCDILVTCPSVLIQEFYFNMRGFDYSVPLFVTCVRGTHIVVTPDIVSNVLHVPRVAHPDSPGCERLKTVSKDELMSAFWKRPSD